MDTAVAIGLGVLIASIIVWIIKGTWWMFKLILKLIKYGLLIWLLIFIKNIYSETFVISHSKNFVTISNPEVIHISEVNNLSNSFSPIALEVDNT